MKEQTFQPVDLSFLRGMRASMQHSVEDGWCRLEIDEQSKDDSFAVKSSGSDTFDNFYRYSLKKSHVACRLCLRREGPTGSIEQVMSLIRKDTYSANNFLEVSLRTRLCRAMRNDSESRSDVAISIFLIVLS